MAVDKSQAPPSTEADVSNPIVHAVKAAAGGTGIIVGTAVVAILVATITRPFCSNNLVGFWSCIAATILVPRFEELEALALTGELPPTNKRLARTATPMMKFWMYAGTAVNVWWLCRLVMENPKEVVAWHLAMAFTLTDIVSGVYHWFQDSYRSKDPELNAALFDNFQIHHERALPAPARPAPVSRRRLSPLPSRRTRSPTRSLARSLTRTLRTACRRGSALPDLQARGGVRLVGAGGRVPVCPRPR